MPEFFEQKPPAESMEEVKKEFLELQKRLRQFRIILTDEDRWKHIPLTERDYAIRQIRETEGEMNIITTLEHDPAVLERLSKDNTVSLLKDKFNKAENSFNELINKEEDYRGE